MDTSFFKSEWFKTISAVIVGGVANELGHYLADRRERKKAIARALADLLEIRVRFIGAELAIKAIKEMFPISPLEQMQVRVVFQNMMGDWSQLAQRYNESVTTVASVAPVLAYYLRSKEIGQRIFQLIDSAAAQTQPDSAGAHAMWQQELSPKLLNEVANTLTGTCLHLAWKHSLVTLWKVRGVVKRTTALPSEANQYLDSLRRMMEQHQRQQGKQNPEQNLQTPPTQTA
jgi:hypothetical protein